MHARALEQVERATSSRRMKTQMAKLRKFEFMN